MRTKLVYTQALAVGNMLPSSSLDGYLNAIGKVDRLAPEEEYALAVKYQTSGDLDAARQLVTAHLKFVVFIAKSYKGYGLPLLDLIQEGNAGLMKAVKAFDPDRGVKLASFAVHWIRAEICEFVLCNWNIVKVATTKSQRKLFFNLRRMKQKIEYLTNRETKQIANTLDVDVSTVTEMEQRLSSQNVSIIVGDSDEPSLPEYYLEDNRYSPHELYSSEEAENQHQATMRKLTSQIQQLDDRSRDIIKSRWVDTDSKPTLADLAVKYNVSQERIRQIEKNAMLKLKAQFN